MSELVYDRVADLSSENERLRAQVERLESQGHTNSRESRKRALRDAVEAQCTYCGARTLPNEPEAHALHGPNSAGNYTHRAFGDDQMCQASLIWSMIRWEDLEDKKS